jgi:hypothetical protein
MSRGPEGPGPRVITFQEWRYTSTLTYLKSTFTTGLVKDLLDNGYMLLMMNMFSPSYIFKDIGPY